MSKPTCQQFTAEGCSVEWDRQGNVKRISYCPLHEAAGQMRDLLQRIKDHADLNMYLSPAKPKPLYIELSNLLDAISRAEGKSHDLR